MGLIDTLSTWTLLVFCILQGTITMIFVPIIALLVIYCLNYSYKCLWDELDPPKPFNETKITMKEALLINKCDENFDRWCGKYMNLSYRLRLIVILLNHKIFFLPFTHFYGYKHFTLRA